MKELLDKITGVVELGVSESMICCNFAPDLKINECYTERSKE